MHGSKVKKLIVVILLITASQARLAPGQDEAGGASTGKEPGVRKHHSVLPPLISEKKEYHDVCGCCAKDIQCDMVEKAIRWKDGNGYDSITKWKASWDYGHDRDNEFCYADSFKVTLDITIELPRWVCEGNAPQTLKDKWAVFIKNLVSHENSHRDIARQAAEEVTLAVSRLPDIRTCSELDREVQSLVQRRMKKLDADQQDYDQATGHGFADRPSFP